MTLQARAEKQLSLAERAAQELETRAKPLKLVTLDEFVTRPLLTWQIRRILQPATLAVVFGPPKGGKTFLCCDLLMHAAHGREWHGCAVPRPLRIAFLAGEGLNGLRVRLHAWLEHHDTAELSGDIRLLPEALSLPDRLDDVLDALREYKPDITEVDTLNAYFGPGDKNSTQDMTRFVAALRQVRDQIGCSVVTLHHTGLADTGRERGSGVLRGAADVVIQVGKDEGDTGLVGFQVVVGRDIEGWDQALSLRLRRVETDWLDDNEQPMATCIVEAANTPVTLAGRGRKLSDSQRITVEAVQELARDKANGNDQVLLARADIVAVAQQHGANRTVVYRNIDQLAPRMNWKLEPGALMVRISR